MANHTVVISRYGFLLVKNPVNYISSLLPHFIRNMFIHVKCSSEICMSQSALNIFLRSSAFCKYTCMGMSQRMIIEFFRNTFLYYLCRVLQRSRTNKSAVLPYTYKMNRVTCFLCPYFIWNTLIYI